MTQDQREISIAFLMSCDVLTEPSYNGSDMWLAGKVMQEASKLMEEASRKEQIKTWQAPSEQSSHQSKKQTVSD